jgi:hypothetical protein
MEELLKEIKDDALVEVEMSLEKLVEKHSDKVVDKAVAELVKLIPGNWDDAAAEFFKPQLKAYVKAEMLELVEEISPKV